MILYHGTNAVIQNIDLSQSRVGKDFGLGFYLTPDEQVAHRQAERKFEQFGEGEVIVYKYFVDDDALTAANTLRFNGYTLDWARFVLNNRRGIGFDKLPIGKKGSCTASKSGSMQGYGHTGFTGTFVWADPANKTVIVFLSNRVYPDTEPNKLARTGVRTALHDILYEAYPVE